MTRRPPPSRFFRVRFAGLSRSGRAGPRLRTLTSLFLKGISPEGKQNPCAHTETKRSFQVSKDVQEGSYS
jgi:hypothetical protein